MEPKVTGVVAMRVRLAAQLAGLDQLALSKATGVARSQLWRIQRGADTRLSTLERIAAATGQPIRWFFDPMPFCPTCGRPLPEPEGEAS